MKWLYSFVQCLTIVLSVAILSGCSSTRKTTGSGKRAGKNEYIYVENNTIRDPQANYAWSYYDDNPTTYFRFKLDNSKSFSLIPATDQLIALLGKVKDQLNSKKDRGNIRSLYWFGTDCDFLTSKTIRTDEGEVLYEVVSWDSHSRSFSTGTVTGGDLVVILFMDQN